MPFIARFGFSSFDVRFCFLLLFVAFCCFSLLVVALSGCSLLLIPTTLHRSRVEANKCKWELKMLFFLLFVARFGFGGCFHLPFIDFCCSSLLVLVFEMESVLSKKPKQEKCIWWLGWGFAARFGFM